MVKTGNLTDLCLLGNLEYSYKLAIVRQYIAIATDAIMWYAYWTVMLAVACVSLQ